MTNRIGIALTLLLLAASAQAMPLYQCKAQCGAKVEIYCGFMRKARYRNCRTRTWRDCKRNRIVCSAADQSPTQPVITTTTLLPAATTTTTTLRPAATTTTTTTSTTTTTVPMVSEYENRFDFAGTLVSGTCGFIGVDTIQFAILRITNSLGQTIVGNISDDNEGGLAFYAEAVRGTATFPAWEVIADSPCAVENLAHTRCGYVWAKLDGFPPRTDAVVTGALEKRWDNPTCTMRWEGTWTRFF